jgi:hypothetical protein
MNMPEIEGIDMIEEQDHLTIHQRGRRISIWWVAIWWRI